MSDSGTPTPDTPAEDTGGIDVADIPGVSNGTLTDAAALADANGATLAETGGRVGVTQTGSGIDTDSVLTVGSGGAFELSTTASGDTAQSGSIDYYANDTATYIRMESDGETRYRVVEEAVKPLDRFNSTLETYLAAGTFTVTNETSTTAVLTATEFGAVDDGGFLGEASSLRGHLVLSQSGQVQNLTITGEQDGDSVRFVYDLRQPLIERATAPGWVSDVPESAALQPELSVDVENNSYLTIDHTGGDAVPANATLSLSANGTSGTVAFDTALESGQTRYAYFTASDGSLVISAEQPSSEATASLDSPASVSIVTDDNVTLHSGSMAWSSSSASADTSGGASDAGGASDSGDS